MTAARSPGGGALHPWVVVREGRQRRWGGDLRRHHIFARLAERTAARIVEDGWTARGIRRVTLGPVFGWLPGPLAERLPRRARRPKLASSEKLRDRLLSAAVHATDPAAVAIYDDPVAQSRALGLPADPAWIDGLARRQARNRSAFRWHVVPTASFAELCGLDLERVIVGGNGTDTGAVTVGPWPDRPTVGVVSGAAPGRGLELLVEASRLARREVADLELRLWLAAGDDAGRRYLDGLRTSVAAEPWIEVSTAPYAELGAALARATALCIPHPPNAYMDVALPVKLFDSLAAGRPLVVTPRHETRAIVERLGVGVVAADDSVDALAAALSALILDDDRAREMGRAAREAAEREFDWQIVGDRIATEVLRREGEL